MGPSLNVDGFKDPPSPVPLLSFYHTGAIPVNVVILLLNMDCYAIVGVKPCDSLLESNLVTTCL